MGREGRELTVRFQDALVLAAKLHASQTRKGTEIPYVAHLLAVAAIALDNGADEEEAIAALLHDAVEDQGGKETAQTIRQMFGDRVARIVEECSDTDESPKPPWRQRKEAYIAHLGGASRSVRLVSASDKLHNARAILADYRQSGEAVWTRFSAPRDDILWYYRSLVSVFRKAGPHALSEELDRVVTELEGLVSMDRSEQQPENLGSLRDVAPDARARCETCKRVGLDAMILLEEEGQGTFARRHVVIGRCASCGSAQVEIHHRDTFDPLDQEFYSWWFVLEKADASRLAEAVDRCYVPFSSACECSIHSALRASCQRLERLRSPEGQVLPVRLSFEGDLPNIVPAAIGTDVAVAASTESSGAAGLGPLDSRYESECPACGRRSGWDGRVEERDGFLFFHQVCTSCNNTFWECNGRWEREYRAKVPDGRRVGSDTTPSVVLRPTRLIGTVIVRRSARPFVLEDGTLRLDVYEPEQPNASERHFSARSMELRVRDAAGFPIDEVRIGEYFCGRCGNWFKANRDEWSVSRCLSCALDQGTEMSEYVDKREAGKPAEMPATEIHEVTPDPRRWGQAFERAVAMEERGQLEEALETFASVSTNAPEYRAALFNEAVLLARLGFLRDAIQRFERLGEEDPGIQSALTECRLARTREEHAAACVGVKLRRNPLGGEQEP